MDMPILVVSTSGKTAIGVNFSRLDAAIPGFGYVGGKQSAQAEIPYPTNDGLFIIDLETGKSKLLVSMADVNALAPPPTDLEGPLMWFHHAPFNPSGTRIFFVAKTRIKGKPMASAAMTINPDGTNLRMNVPYEWDATHYDWMNNEQMIITTAYEGVERSHLIFKDGEGKESYQPIAQGLITSNGHPNFSSNGKWLLTDTYPDALRKISMFLVDMETKAVFALERFYSPEGFEKAVRCDLHARWNRTGNKIVFDSSEDGTRQVYVMELEFE